MSLVAKIRQRQQTWARRALGLFVAVWLNLALQPCAMALESMQDNDCPNCPPAQAHEHDGMHAGMGHEMPCASAAADCSFSEDLNYDGRSDQPKLKMRTLTRQLRFHQPNLHYLTVTRSTSGRAPVMHPFTRVRPHH